MTDVTDYPISFNTAEPTREALSIEINTLQREVERLGNVNESISSDVRCKAGMISEFEDRLKEAIENDEIDHDLAREFADIFGLELSKTYSITIEASWSGTITVPFGQDVDDLDFDFPFPELSYSCNDFEMDIDEDNTDYNVSEQY